MGSGIVRSSVQRIRPRSTSESGPVGAKQKPVRSPDFFSRRAMQVMSQEPYRSARRVFWVVDNGSSHRGQASIDRLQGRWDNLVLVHTPVHASWLNQVEIYFSVLQRKVLTPNDFTSTAEVEDRILRFQRHYEQVARPFRWKFTRRDLQELLDRLQRYDAATRLAA